MSAVFYLSSTNVTNNGASHPFEWDVEKIEFVKFKKWGQKKEDVGRMLFCLLDTSFWDITAMHLFLFSKKMLRLFKKTFWGAQCSPDFFVFNFMLTNGIFRMLSHFIILSSFFRVFPLFDFLSSFCFSNCSTKAQQHLKFSDIALFCHFLLLFGPP